MTEEFDIHQRVIDDDGEYDEDVALDYRGELMARFSSSPEAQQVMADASGIGWADTFMSYGMGYLGVTPPEMTPNQVDEILFDIFPAKVSAQPGAGQEIIAELRGFWAFLHREFRLANAGPILTMLRRVAGNDLEQELQNPNNFGMAKSFFMLGQKSGFDMTTEEGLQEFAATHNAALSSNPLPPSPFPFTSSLDVQAPKAGHAAKKTAAHRKMAKASRKKNRKK